MTLSRRCDFCDTSDMEWRIIRREQTITSFVSMPWFRWGHCVVIPNRHIEVLSQLSPEESVAIFAELGRLATLLDTGYGSSVLQKYQPQQPENQIKRDHLHMHVVPKAPNDSGIFPVPEPNSFEGLWYPDDTEVAQLAEQLR